MNTVNAITNRSILVAAAAVQASGTFLKDSYGMSIELFPVASTRMCLLDDLSCSSFRSSPNLSEQFNVLGGRFYMLHTIKIPICLLSDRCSSDVFCSSHFLRSFRSQPRRSAQSGVKHKEFSRVLNVRSNRNLDLI